MPYFPTECFSLIKEYMGVNGAKYHHKKVAQIVNGYMEYCRVKYADRVECFPLVYNIQYVEELLEEHKEILISYGVTTYQTQIFHGSLELLVLSYDELEEEVFHLQSHLRRLFHFQL